MIIIKNREMLIPGDEQYIGTNFDNGSEVRTFRTDRYTTNGSDLSQCSFVLHLLDGDTELPDKALDKTSDEKYVYLLWKINSSQLASAGAIHAIITCANTDESVRWSSYSGVFYVEDLTTCIQGE